MIKLTSILASDQKGLIGINNSIPWKIKEDMDHFRSYTLGKPVLMGINTFLSLDRPLEGRVNIVLSSDIEKIKNQLKKFEHQETSPVFHAKSLYDFFSCDLSSLGDELVCIGGSKLYNEIFPYCDEIIYTKFNFTCNFSKEDSVTFMPIIPSYFEKVKESSLCEDLGVITTFINKNCNNVYDIKTGKRISIEDRYIFLNN